jgi:hypothetical protein
MSIVHTVSPLPVHGDVIVGRDAVGKVLRVSRHAESDRVVLSIWDGGRCAATLRLAAADVPELVRVLAGTLVDDSPPGLAAVPSAGGAPGRGKPHRMPVRRWADRARDEVRRRLTGDA